MKTWDLVNICSWVSSLDKSVEFGEHKGLGLISGNVEYLGDSFKNRNNVKIPHMGWNTVKIREEYTREKIFESLSKEFDVYFAHSYWIKSLIKDYVFTETKYADVKFCSAIKKNNVFGFQFHPENSGLVGIRLLKNIFGTRNSRLLKEYEPFIKKIN